MESANVFDLQKAIEDWLKTNTEDLQITEDDKEEMLDHFRSIIHELQKLGLSDEEAFAVAKIRFGGAENWGEDFKQVSSDNFQVKKIITFFYGVMVYFILYLAILFFINLTFMALFKFTDTSVAFKLSFIHKIYYLIYIAVPIILFLLYRFRNDVIPLLKRKQLSLGRLLWTFALLLIVLAGERYTYPLIRKVVEPIENWKHIVSSFGLYQRDFQYFFPITIVVSFIILYLLYRKKNYIGNS